MSAEEQQVIDKLLNIESGVTQQRAALKWLSEYLEQGYILNLRPSRAIMNALEDFAEMPQIDATLSKRAVNLRKKYKPR